MPTDPDMPAAYQRVIIRGIPCWKDAEGGLYYYESSAQPGENRIKIGTESTGINAELLGEVLTAYRAAQKPRARATKN